MRNSSLNPRLTMDPYGHDIVDNAWEDDKKWYGDRDKLNKESQSLGLTKGYVPAWHSGHAIREFYQNW